ncbi:MAG: hypothetical protein GY870_19110 [archaeon]|nr:hypothetical protein [archaeon]
MMERHEQLRIIAGILLIISAITHVLQLLVVTIEQESIIAALYGGILYGVLGVLLIITRKNNWITILTDISSIIYPTIGGSMALFNLIDHDLAQPGFRKWFMIWHIFLDCVIVPMCIYSFIVIQKNKKNGSKLLKD